MLALHRERVFLFRTPYHLGRRLEFPHFGDNSFHPRRFRMLHGDSKEHQRLGILSMYSRGRQGNSRVHRSGIPTWPRCGLHDSFRRWITNVCATRGLPKCRRGLVMRCYEQREFWLSKANETSSVNWFLLFIYFSRLAKILSVALLVLHARLGSQRSISRRYFAITSKRVLYDESYLRFFIGRCNEPSSEPTEIWVKCKAWESSITFTAQNLLIEILIDFVMYGESWGSTRWDLIQFR